jgi:hypothetical protein
LTLYFSASGQAIAVERQGALSGVAAEDAVALLTALLAGPTPEEQALGLSSRLPPGVALVAVRGDRRRA